MEATRLLWATPKLVSVRWNEHIKTTFISLPATENLGNSPVVIDCLLSPLLFCLKKLDSRIPFIPA